MLDFVAAEVAGNITECEVVAFPILKQRVADQNKKAVIVSVIPCVIAGKIYFIENIPVFPVENDSAGCMEKIILVVG